MVNTENTKGSPIRPWHPWHCACGTDNSDSKWRAYCKACGEPRYVSDCKSCFGLKYRLDKFRQALCAMTGTDGNASDFEIIGAVTEELKALRKVLKKVKWMAACGSYPSSIHSYIKNELATGASTDDNAPEENAGNGLTSTKR